jgi:serpin B
MKRTLHLRDSEVGDKLDSTLVARLGGQRIQQRGKGAEVRIANSLWAPKGQPLGESFLERARREGTVKQIDFSDPDTARRTINGSVEKQTGGHIKDVLPSGAVNRDTKLVLTNAIYFKASWANPFKKSETREGDFHVSPDRSVRLPLMSQVGQFGYHQTVGLRVLELPYAGRNLSLVVLLPKKSEGLPALEKALTLERLAGCLAGLKPSVVEVILPRFRLSTSTSLNRPLAKMGMPLAFSSEADFSGIDKTGSLSLSVFHKAFLDVAEEGTEASAGTSSAVKAKSVTAPEHVFRANRPFLFLILDKRAGGILFLGRFAQPKP